MEQETLIGSSFSTVDHLPWDVRAIFELAVGEGILNRNPAKLIFTLKCTTAAPERVMTREDVVGHLSVLEFRERLIAKLTILAGMLRVSRVKLKAGRRRLSPIR